MALVDKVKTFLRGGTPAAKLIEIQAGIEAAVAERAQHQGRRAAEIVAAMDGDPDAARRVEAIDQAVAALDAKLRDLRDAQAELRRRVAAAEDAARKAEAEARPMRIAELRRERLALMQTVTEAMETAAAAMKATQANADALAAELGDEAARRFLSFGAFRMRVQSAFARVFAIDPNGQLSAKNSLLGIASGEVGARSHWSATEHELQGMDHLVRFFVDAAGAEAAKERLAARGDRTIVLPLAGGAYTLVRAEHAFGDRASADEAARDAAMRGKPPLAVVEHAGGYVAVAARFAGEAA